MQEGFDSPGILRLGVVTQAIHAGLLAPVEAAPTVLLIERQPHALPTAASPRELAHLAALAAVEGIAVSVDALVTAAAPPGAPGAVADHRIDAALLVLGCRHGQKSASPTSPDVSRGCRTES